MINLRLIREMKDSRMYLHKLIIMISVTLLMSIGFVMMHEVLIGQIILLMVLYALGDFLISRLGSLLKHIPKRKEKPHGHKNNYCPLRAFKP